jgi:hypothetical protein
LVENFNYSLGKIRCMETSMLSELEKYVVRKPSGQSDEVEPLEAVLEPYVKLRDSLTLGLEAGVREHVDSKIKEVRREHLNKMARYYFPVSLDQSFLSMRHKEKISICVGYYEFKDVSAEVSLPRFAVYSLDSPECSIEMTTHLMGTVWTEKRVNRPFSLTEVLREPLLQSLMIEMHEGKSYFGWRSDYEYKHTFTSSFRGIIPEEIKKKIPFARELFGEQLYIIAEVEKWGCHSRDVSPITSGDPLLVGVRDDTCFLISEFDTTPMEDYVRREFTKENKR